MNAVAQTRTAVLFRDGLAAPDVSASLLCTRPVAAWPIADATTLSQALEAGEAARCAGQAVVFALDYEVGAFIEPATQMLSDDAPHPAGRRHVPLGYVWIFEAAHWLTRAEADAWLAAGDRGAPAGCVRGDAALDLHAYAGKLQSIREAIANGEVYQVNFTFPIDLTIFGDPARVFMQLAQAQPTAHAVYIDMPEYQALSLSPELFFAVSGDQITVRPMKGTAPRGADQRADQTQADRLQASEKNRAENLMIVDLLRNDLGRVAVPGSVSVEALFEVEAYPTVHQMTSTVSARLATQHLADIIRGLFPCGSVTGAPKIAAMKKIAEGESAPRGLYTGSIGWAVGERIRANVAIRTIVLDPPVGETAAMCGVGRTGVLGVGSGIVWDSVASEEYAECLLKSEFLLRPDPGFTLFETLRLELPPDALADTLPLVEIYPQIRRHAQRLASSSRALGFAYQPDAFEQALWAVKAEVRQKQGMNDITRVFRVRIDLAHDGLFTTSWAPLPPLAERVALIWSETRLRGDDPLLRHKTSARGVYDQAIEMAMAEQAFDSLFCNERGEVCEGARSSVFVREGARLLTPPLRCGLLPGVLRGALLDSGEASEAILGIGDIKAASREGRLRVGNALRGLLPAFIKEGSSAA